ncbi:hypothetical protein [Achromobacter sp.]|uniref:hypothetical protein n=1 Tax=Achromobacter sp. TaxID=134375 RepID=UPI002F9326CE
MRAEEVSLWVVPANGGEELAFLIKAPTSAIKALLAGCRLDLLFGRHGTYLCAGARIHDMPDAPMLISSVQREQEEHGALKRLLREQKTPVFLFNEMDACLAWTNMEISESDASEVAKIVNDEPALYVGPFTKDCSHALDCFCYSNDPSQRYPGATKIPLIDIQSMLEAWRVNHVSYMGVRTHQTITIDDLNEGEMFERAVWASLESVFPLTLHKSPQVQIGEKVRELTDVLSFYQYGSFLIEAKDLSVLQAGYGRSQDRRTNGVQKQVRKAIAQLVGAAKALLRGDRIMDEGAKELDVVRDQRPHCIVLISELMHTGDWSDVENQLRKATLTTQAFFHLIDLREFITLLKGSSGKAELLDFNLMQRAKIFAETGSVHIRSRVGPTDSA